MSGWIGIALGLASAFWAPEAAASPTNRGMLEGVVTSAPIGLAVPNASVTLRSTSTGWFEVRTTDRDGLFRFENLPAGLYSLEAQPAENSSGSHPRGVGLQQAFVSPVIVIPGLPVTENLVLLETTRSRRPLPRPDLSEGIDRVPPAPILYVRPKS
jgi:hypothetical protein